MKLFMDRFENFVHRNGCPITSASYLDAIADLSLILSDSMGKRDVDLVGIPQMLRLAIRLHPAASWIHHSKTCEYLRQDDPWL